MLGNIQLNPHILGKLNTQEAFAVAVSGGGDSVALYHLLLQNFSAEKIHILHFNHKLRDNAELDEKFVLELAEKYESPIKVHHWLEEKTGNLQQAARRARYQFFNDYCQKNNIKYLLTGHTMGDVLETFFMRLGRGSGLTGLTSLKLEGHWQELQLLRPMLDISRLDLREYLAHNDILWREDESNENEKYLRVRVRNLLNSFSEAGLDKEAILASYHALVRAEESLENEAEQLFLTYWQNEKLSLDVLKTASFELQLRLIGLMINHYFKNEMLPRTSKRKALLAKLFRGEKASLGGVVFTVKNNAILTALEHG